MMIIVEFEDLDGATGFSMLVGHDGICAASVGARQKGDSECWRWW